MKKKCFFILIVALLVCAISLVFSSNAHAISYGSGDTKQTEVICSYGLVSPGIDQNLNTYSTIEQCGLSSDDTGNGICIMNANIGNNKMNHIFHDEYVDGDDLLETIWYSIYEPWNMVSTSTRVVGGDKTKKTLILPYTEDPESLRLLVAANSTSGACGSNYECPEYTESGNEMIAHDNAFKNGDSSKCPKYIVIKSAPESFVDLWWNYFLEEYAEKYDQVGDYLYLEINNYKIYEDIQTKSSSQKTDLDLFKKLYKNVENGKYDLSESNMNTAKTAIGYMKQLKIYYPTNSDEEYKNYINNFSKNSDYYVLPLVSFSAYKGNTPNEVVEKNNNVVLENLEVFSETVVNKWYEKITGLLNDLKSSCSGGATVWDDYINMKNYSGDINYFKQAYISNSSSREAFDSSISETCWNARQKLVDVYWSSFRGFAANIGLIDGDLFLDWDPATGKGNPYYMISKTSKMSEDFSKNYAKQFTTFQWLIKTLTDGVDKHLDDSQSTDEEVAELDGLYKEAENLKRLADIYKNDRCAYKCGGTGDMTDEYYKTCKERNTQYKECQKQISDNYDSCYKENCNCDHIPDSNAQKSCKESCETKALECVSTKGDAFTYKDYKDKLDQVEKDYQKKVKEIESAINNNRKTLFYVAADPMGIKWKFAPYEGKCEDVAFLHYIWNFITIGAPFLVIILGSIDYFKNVMNTDQNARNKNKKNFTRRVIALVLLILVPVIIRIVLANLAPSGSTASSVKLMQCIVNGK